MPRVFEFCSLPSAVFSQEYIYSIHDIDISRCFSDLLATVVEKDLLSARDHNSIIYFESLSLRFDSSALVLVP